MGQVLGKTGSMTGNVTNAIQSVTSMSSRHISMGRIVHRLSKQHSECMKTGSKFEPHVKSLWSEVNEVERYRHTGACMMPHIQDLSVLHVRTSDLALHRGDVVVVKAPTVEGDDGDKPKALLRRIAGVPGDVLTRRATAAEENDASRAGGAGTGGGGDQNELVLDDNMLWVSKDNQEAEGADSSDFGPVSKDAIIGCAVRIGDAGSNTVLNSTETEEKEKNNSWIELIEIEEVIKGFQSYASSKGAESEQTLKDSLGFFDGESKKDKLADNLHKEVKSETPEASKSNAHESAAAPKSATSASTSPQADAKDKTASK